MHKITDTEVITEFECATKLWNTGTLSGKTASLDVMKHLTQMGFDFVGAENAYALAIND